MAIPQDVVDGTIGRINGSATQVGVLYSPNCNLYNIYVRTASAAVNLQTEDSSGGDKVINGVIESIVKELNPLAWFVDAASTGLIRIVLDKNADEAAINSQVVAAELTTRLRRLSPVGPNAVVITGTSVWPATSVVFGDNNV
jgi:hypothetical protein